MPLFNAGAPEETGMPQETEMTNESAPMGAMDAAAQSDPDLMGEDDGDDEAYKQEIMANLEQHMNSLPDDAKQFVAEYGTTPKGATLLGILGGDVVYEYFAQFIDPSRDLVVQPNSQGQPGAMAPNPMAQAQPQAAAQPQSQPQAQPAPQGILNM